MTADINPLSKHKSLMPVIIGVVVGGSIALIVIGFVFVIVLKRRKKTLPTKPLALEPENLHQESKQVIILED